MPRQVLACHVVRSRPDKIVKQEGGSMPECRDLQSGVIGFYEWIEVPSTKELTMLNEQVQGLTLGVYALAFVLMCVGVFCVHRLTK